MLVTLLSPPNITGICKKIKMEQCKKIKKKKNLRVTNDCGLKGTSSCRSVP